MVLILVRVLILRKPTVGTSTVPLRVFSRKKNMTEDI